VSEITGDVNAISNAVRRLGIEFVLEFAPRRAGRPALVTARAQKRGTVADDDVSVVAASSL